MSRRKFRGLVKTIWIIVSTSFGIQTRRTFAAKYKKHSIKWIQRYTRSFVWIWMLEGFICKHLCVDSAFGMVSNEFKFPFFFFLKFVIKCDYVYDHSRFWWTEKKKSYKKWRLYVYASDANLHNFSNHFQFTVKSKPQKCCTLICECKMCRMLKLKGKPLEQSKNMKMRKRFNLPALRDIYFRI